MLNLSTRQGAEKCCYSQAHMGSGNSKQFASMAKIRAMHFGLYGLS